MGNNLFVTKAMINFNDLKNKLDVHNKVMANFAMQNKLSRGQVIFERVISLSNIFNSLDEFQEETKSFPVIDKLVINSHDDIRYEPVLNRNLLKMNLLCLQKLNSLLENNSGLKRLVASELEQIRKLIIEVDDQINTTPKILIGDFGARRNIGLNKKPKVSIITTSMNLVNLIEETIRSVENQNYDDLEYIIIDGGSTDGSLDIVKQHPNVVFISEKDTGYADAFWKGLRLARGDYIMQCCVSDSYATPNWIKKCVEILDSNKNVSLVWGFYCSINNESKMVEIVDPEFHYVTSPQQDEMFYYWLKSYRHYSEGNLCVRKSVLLRCYPSVEDSKKNYDWLEFSYRFNSRGYLAVRLPVLANFYHINHAGQLHIEYDKNGWGEKMREKYFKKVRLYKWKIILGFKRHLFIDSDGNFVDIKFNRIKHLVRPLIRIWK